MMVLLDVDGPVCDWLGGALEVVEDVTGKRFYRDEVRNWLMFHTLGLTAAQVREIEHEIDQPGWCAALKPTLGAYEGVEALRDLGYVVHYVTSPWITAKNWTYERTEWLVRHNFAAGAHHVTHTSAKYLLQGDIFVDDHPGNVNLWQASNKAGQGLLWSAPYNRFAEGYRVGGWDDLVSYAKWSTGK